MARPQKQTVEYFPHDSNACSGDTLTVLQSRFGNDGYAFWFKLLEKLSSTEGHYIDCSNPTKWQLLLAKTGVNELLGVEIMNLLVEMQAIDKALWDSKLIWCQKLVDNISDVYKNRRREIPQKPITTDINSISTDDNPITTGSNPQSKVKESKVKESIYIHLFSSFWKTYPRKTAKQNAQKAFVAAVNEKTNGYTEETFTAMLIEAVNKAKKSEQWNKDEQFIPHASTWLNGKRWEDEIKEKDNHGNGKARKTNRGLPDRKTGYTPAPTYPDDYKYEEIQPEF